MVAEETAGVHGVKDANENELCSPESEKSLQKVAFHGDVSAELNMTINVLRVQIITNKVRFQTEITLVFYAAVVLTL